MQEVPGFLVLSFLKTVFYYKTAAKMPEPLENRCGCSPAHGVFQTIVFVERNGPKKTTPKSLQVYSIKSGARFENY